MILHRCDQVTRSLQILAGVLKLLAVAYKVIIMFGQYLHSHCESLNEPLQLRCHSYLHGQIYLKRLSLQL